MLFMPKWSSVSPIGGVNSFCGNLVKLFGWLMRLMDVERN